jgi:hypothetical protein
MKFILPLLFFIKFVSSQKQDDDYLNYEQYSDDIIFSNDDINGYTDVEDFFNLKSFGNYLSNIVSRNLLTCDSSVTNKLVDWTSIYGSPVKSSGLCLNSGWAFAAVQQV